ncbi:hypothetical protein B296_00009328 [Ensete ventricosum]|uniref:Uncharacterized protein n=1 Tax=Ensete ventricosum TaxID=4639 RepID=A0A427B0Q7_ENSVE|nr:hypothetical protein B296_00009328 [Ensete ventricosum]
MTASDSLQDCSSESLKGFYHLVSEQRSSAPLLLPFITLTIALAIIVVTIFHTTSSHLRATTCNIVVHLFHLQPLSDKKKEKEEEEEGGRKEKKSTAATLLFLFSPAAATAAAAIYSYHRPPSPFLLQCRLSRCLPCSQPQPPLGAPHANATATSLSSPRPLLCRHC